jgi:2-methylisocitrate lyase-like PEP mutase family enzyme
MTITETQRQAAVTFRDLHRAGDPLRLANVWDLPSARLVAASGAPALATTSAGVAWSLGVADGDHIDRAAALDRIGAIAGAVSLPLSADIESGFATSADGVGDTVRRVIEAGAIGVNIEDATHRDGEPLRDPVDQAGRIAAARAAADATGIPLFVNARTDIYLLAVGPESERLRATLERTDAFLSAGADGVFVPGVADPTVIAALVAGIDAPVNILVGPGSPSVDALADLGVARVSLGSTVIRAAYALIRRGADELLRQGTYASLEGDLPYGDVNALLTR